MPRGAFELGNAAATLLILRATELLDEQRSHDASVTIALLLYAAYNLGATLASLQGGRVGDRRGSLTVLVLGVGTFLLAYVGFAFASGSILFLAAAFLVAGVGIGVVETAERLRPPRRHTVLRQPRRHIVLRQPRRQRHRRGALDAGFPTAAFLFLAAAMLASLVSLTLARES